MKNAVETLNEIEASIVFAKANTKDLIDTLETKAFEVFSELMKSEPYHSIVMKMISDVESTKELTSSDDEYYSQWIRADFSQLIDLKNDFQRELLTQFFGENHCIRIDFKNDALMYSIGPAILINEYGDILDQDSDKWIINRKDYENESERNQLIEKWMDKNGYFPSTIRIDGIGNAFYVNTKVNEGEGK